MNIRSICDDTPCTHFLFIFFIHTPESGRAMAAPCAAAALTLGATPGARPSVALGSSWSSAPAAHVAQTRYVHMLHVVTRELNVNMEAQTMLHQLVQAAAAAMSHFSLLTTHTFRERGATFTASILPATGITLGHTARYASTNSYVSVSSPGRPSQMPGSGAQA